MYERDILLYYKVLATIEINNHLPFGMDVYLYHRPRGRRGCKNLAPPIRAAPMTSRARRPPHHPPDRDVRPVPYERTDKPAAPPPPPRTHQLYRPIDRRRRTVSISASPPVSRAALDRLLLHPTWQVEGNRTGLHACMHYGGPLSCFYIRFLF